MTADGSQVYWFANTSFGAYRVPAGWETRPRRNAILGVEYPYDGIHRGFTPLNARACAGAPSAAHATDHG